MTSTDPARPVPRPPAHLAPYVEAMGASEAVRFLMKHGGSALHISLFPRLSDSLVQDFGIDAARALATLAAAGKLPREVPLGKPWIARYLFLIESLPKAEIARKLHVSRPTVASYLPDPAQRKGPEKESDGGPGSPSCTVPRSCCGTRISAVGTRNGE